MAKRVDPRRVKIHWTRTPDEWARILGVHKNTIHRWIKSEGLEAITEQRPYLIRGFDLKEFLTRKRKKRRFNCKTSEMPCFSCNQPRTPADIGLEYTPTSDASGRLVGLCGVCSATMNRMIRFQDISKKFPGYEVTLTRCQRTLCGSSNPLLNVDLQGAGQPQQKYHPETAENLTISEKENDNGS